MILSSNILYLKISVRQRKSHRWCRVRSAHFEELLPNSKYLSGDGKKKTTMEDVFRSTKSQKEFQSAPWEIGWQMNERNIQWIDAFQKKLILNFAAEELQITEKELEQRLQLLMDILPGIAPRMSSMAPQRVAQLMRYTGSLAKTLVGLKTIFPKARITFINETTLRGHRLMLHL